MAPASFEKNGQKVRSPSDILAQRFATCLDLALLFSACCEQVGLHPLVLMHEGHAYRIDLGVVDPATPGRYLLGVECDGATYHRAATARDRDKLRQLILEGLGWELYRIWSTDWWHDSDKETRKLLARLDELSKPK